MSIHVQQTSATVRFYKKDHSYANYDPFEAVATLQFIGEKHCFLSALHGKITKTVLCELAGYLYGLGLEQLVAERHGKLVYYEVTRYLPKRFR